MGIAQTVQRPFVVCPAFTDSHPDVQMDTSIELALQRQASLPSRVSQTKTAFADHDSLLRAPFDPDDGGDVDYFLCFPFFGIGIGVARE